MATIKQNIDAILSAKYGRDVRAAIAESISQCYDDTTTSTTKADNAATRANAAADNAENSVVEVDGFYNGVLAFDAGSKTYYNLGTASTGGVQVGEFLDIDNPTSGNDVHHKIIIRDLKPGETFTVNVVDGTTARPYAILDRDGILLEKPSGSTKSGTITIPDNGHTIIFQVRATTVNDCYVVRDLNLYTIDDRVKTAYDRIETTNNNIDVYLPLNMSIANHSNFHFSSTDFEIGSWAYNKKNDSYGNKRVRCKTLLPVGVGTKFTYSVPEDIQIFIGALDTYNSSAYRTATGWVSGDGTFLATIDCVIYILFRKTGEASDISLEDLNNVNLSVDIVNNYSQLFGIVKPVWNTYSQSGHTAYITSTYFRNITGKIIAAVTPFPGTVLRVVCYSSSGANLGYGTAAFNGTTARGQKVCVQIPTEVDGTPVDYVRVSILEYNGGDVPQSVADSVCIAVQGSEMFPVVSLLSFT